MLSSYRLHRVPQDQTLQAWNAADELYLSRYRNLAHSNAILLINDSFGALATALNEVPIDWWYHSAMSYQALCENKATNHQPIPNTYTQLQTDRKYEHIVIHIPKSVNLFAWQLEQASKHLSEQGTVYALGMVKHISSGHIKAMNALFSHANPGRAEKKARVIELQSPTGVTASQVKQQTLATHSLTLTNLPGCFAENTIDQGAQVFIEFFNALPNCESLLDLGCGNGVLSLAYLRTHHCKHITLVDENYQALISAQENFENHYPNATPTFRHTNSLNGLTDEKFDLVLCNPPFHQENTLTESIATGMFRDVAKHLSATGELWIVANRHLNYIPVLNECFARVKTVSKHAKFIVLCCQLSKL